MSSKSADEPEALNGYSMELCAGTHTRATGEIGLFRIVSGDGDCRWGSPHRGCGGPKSYDVASRESERLRALASKLNSPVAEVEKKLDALLGRYKELEKALKAASQRQSAERAKELAETAEVINGMPTIIANLGQIDGDALQAIVDSLKSEFRGVVVLAASDRGIVSLSPQFHPISPRKFRRENLSSKSLPLSKGKVEVVRTMRAAVAKSLQTLMTRWLRRGSYFRGKVNPASR